MESNEDGTARLRLGLIGCGRVVERFHLPALMIVPDWTIAGAVDASPARRQWAESSLPGVPVFERADDLLGNVDIDAVLVATPPGLQASLTMAALARGLHVLLEKPGGKSSQDAEAMAAEAKRAECHFWVGFNRRFMPNYQALRHALREIRPGTSLRGWYNLAFDPRGWDSVTGYGEDAEGGGVLYDVVPHQLDSIPWLTPRSIKELTLRTWTKTESSEEIGFVVTFADGGFIQCTARHAWGYDESLYLEGGGTSFYLYPTGLHHGNGRQARQARIVAARYWLDRKLIRLGLSEDVMAAGFRSQWHAFGKVIRGAEGVTGSTGRDLTEVHQGLETILSGRARVRDGAAARGAGF